MNRTLKATAVLMLMMVFAAGCTKPDEPNNGGNGGGGNSSMVTYTVSFDANGGLGYMKPQVFMENSPANIEVIQFYRDDDFFCSEWNTWNTMPDGKGISYKNCEEIVVSENMTLYAQWKPTKGELNGHEWVDLDLRSGIRWATCNIGATSPYEYGYYYSYGAVEPYEGMYSPMLPPLDAATVNWGEGWRMPMLEEIKELVSYCGWQVPKWITENGVNGMRIPCPRSGCSVFFPAAGRWQVDSVVIGKNLWGCYWSRTSDFDFNCDMMVFDSVDLAVGTPYPVSNFFSGFSVRPVCSAE